MPPRLAQYALLTVTLLARSGAAVEPASDTPLVKSTSITLHWSAPEACPTETDFRRRVDDYLGESAENARVQTLANAVVVATNNGYHVTLRLEQSGQTRTRILDTVSCAEILDASALVVALAIDPSVGSRLPGSTSTSNASIAAAPRPVGVTGFPVSDCQCPTPAEKAVITSCSQRVVTAPAPTQGLLKSKQSPNLRPSFELFQISEANVRRLPGLSLGLGLGAALDYSSLRYSISVLTSDGVKRGQSGGGDFRLVEGRTQACYLFHSPLSVGPCASLSVGVLTAKGFDVDVPERKTKPWLSSGVGGLFRYTHANVSEVALYANLEHPITRPYFELSGTSLYRPPAVGFNVGLMLGLRLE
jgi:hypothetical protein